MSAAEDEPATPDPQSQDELEATLTSLRQEVESLQSKLGRLHGTDLVSLRRAYTSLTQHVSALEGEWAGTVGCATGLQTAVISPELVARELGVAGMIAFGLTLMQHTLRGVVGRDVVSRAAWLLGAGVVVFRLTGGTLARWVAVTHANARVKHELLQRLQLVDDRIRIMAALRQWAPPDMRRASGSSSSGEGAGERRTPPPLGGPSPQRSTSGARDPSPAEPTASGSSCSSLELVERPGTEGSPGTSSQQQQQQQRSASGAELSRDVLRKYARLGKKA